MYSKYKFNAKLHKCQHAITLCLSGFYEIMYLVADPGFLVRGSRPNRKAFLRACSEYRSWKSRPQCSRMSYCSDLQGPHVASILHPQFSPFGILAENCDFFFRQGLRVRATWAPTGRSRVRHTPAPWGIPGAFSALQSCILGQQCNGIKLLHQFRLQR